MEENNSGAMVPYATEFSDFQMQFITGCETIERSISFDKKLRKFVKQGKENCNFIRNTNLLQDTEIKHDQQKVESMLAALRASESRITDLKQKLLFTEAEKENAVKIQNDSLKKYEERWLTCKSRFESLPFLKENFDVLKEIESVKDSINSLVAVAKQRDADIRTKKEKLWSLDKKRIVEMADYLIHKRPALLKAIDGKRGMKKNNTLPASFTKLAIESKRNSNDNAKFGKGFQNTSVLPKLQLQDMTCTDYFNYDELQKNDSWGESYSANKFDVPKQIDSNIDNFANIYLSTCFLTPRKSDTSKKYSDKKLINILDDIKLDISGTHEILSKLNPYNLHDVDVITAAASQPVVDAELTDKVTDQNEVVEEIDLTKNVSEEDITREVILPPTQFLDPTQQNSQEKRVTFNTVISENLPNYVEDDANAQESEEVNNTCDNQLDTSAVSQDSYKKIKDYVFKKHNFNLSPEFEYRKNTVTTKMADEIVTSEYFDKNKKCNENNVDSAKEQMDTQELLVCENTAKRPKLNQANTTSDTALQEQKGSSSAAPTLGNYIQDISSTLNISLNTTGCEEDVDVPCFVDPNLLLSPKSDEGMETTNNNAETVPNFMAEWNKKSCSFFGSICGNKPESEVQKQSFNFTFGGEEKTKRGGLFSMFR